MNSIRRSRQSPASTSTFSHRGRDYSFSKHSSISQKQYNLSSSGHRHNYKLHCTSNVRIVGTTSRMIKAKEEHLCLFTFCCFWNCHLRRIERAKLKGLSKRKTGVSAFPIRIKQLERKYLLFAQSVRFSYQVSYI